MGFEYGNPLEWEHPLPERIINGYDPFYSHTLW